MTAWLIRVLLAFAIARPALAADELADFNAAVERAAAHTRIAIDLLGTQSAELAAAEIGEAKDAWGELTSRFGMHPPAAFKNQRLYVETMVDIPTRMVTAMMMLDMGRGDMASTSLQAIRTAVSRLRRDAGVEVLADCVLNYNLAIAAVVKESETPDWSRAETASEILSRTDAIARTAARCNEVADEKLRTQPEFRRLIEGTQASLAQIPRAIAKRDSDLLRRLIGELRVFDRLLTVRYG